MQFPSEVVLDINKEGTFLLALETLSLLFLSQIVYRDRKTKKKKSLFYHYCSGEKNSLFSHSSALLHCKSMYDWQHV